MRLAALFWNPIVVKEYRSRMRTIRSPLALTIYILLLGALGWAVFSGMAASAQGSFGQQAGSNYGPTLFTVLVLFQMLLLTFITPALTAGAISGERERQTIDLLFCTRIPPFSIIWGKLLASMSFVIVLLVVSIPIFSLVFLFGGIEPDQLVTAFLVTIVTTLTLGTLGILFSTLARRTLPSTVAAYGAAFVLVFGTLLWGLLFPTQVNPNATVAPAPPAITYLSPVLSLGSIANPGISGGYGIRNGGPSFTPLGVAGGGVVCQSAPSGFGQACSTVYALPYRRGPVGPVIGGFSYNTANTIPSGPFAGWQLWQATVTLQIALSLLALAVSAALLPPMRRLPWTRRRAAVAAV